tara:strand:+ start:279 stop:1076 length:798 start_codon:yes stop_codon:yes gene_type:complete
MTWYSILKQERVKIVASIEPVNYGLVKYEIATILRNYVPEYKDKPRLKEGIKQSMVDETRKKLTKNKEMSEEEIEEFIRDKFYDTDKMTTERTGRIERESYPKEQLDMLFEVEGLLEEFGNILSNLTFRTEKGAKERRIESLLETTTLKPKFGESDEEFRERVSAEGGAKGSEYFYEVGIELSKAKPKSMNDPLGARSKTQFEFDKNPKDTLEEGEEFVLDVVLDYLEDAKDVVSEMNYAFANYNEKAGEKPKEVLRFSYDIISV